MLGYACTFKNWMLILVLLCENECQRWDASRYIKARRESSGNFMFWKSLNFAEYCFHVVIVDVHTSRVACHTCRDLYYCSKQGRGTSQHAIIATYHRSVKQWKVFIDLESIVFSGSTRLLWIRVSPGSTVVVPALRVKMTFMRIQNDIHVEMALILTHSQSNFCIFHNTTQSVIISEWKLVASFHMKSYRSSSTFVTIDLLFHDLSFSRLLLAMLAHIWMKVGSKLSYEELQIKFNFRHDWPRPRSIGKNVPDRSWCCNGTLRPDPAK